MSCALFATSVFEPSTSFLIPLVRVGTEFNEEGINKILDAYNGDLKPFTNKLQAVIDAGEEYQTYSAIADGQTGSVKFIYKLASIDAKADSDK